MRRASYGYTLLELLLVVGILAILGSIGVGYYANTARDVEIATIAKQIVGGMRGARSSAIAGENAQAWGLHFVNADRDYFEVYSTPTDYSDPSKSVQQTVYLTNGVSFSDPASLATKDILFSRIAGTTSASSITVTSVIESITVNVSSLGVVY